MAAEKTIARLVVGGLCFALVTWFAAGFVMEGEDALIQTVPLLVVLGGGVAGERSTVACELFRQGHGWRGVVLTGGNEERFVADRREFITQCGVPEVLVRQWPHTANSFEEMRAVGAELNNMPDASAIVVSDALHMPRLRFLRGYFDLGGRVFLRQSRLNARSDMAYAYSIFVFWFREPLAYVYYRLRY